ncbi:MAG: GNAT family N-acetyltransferase [Myxococcota bacterium]|nr:GNAT family N-acetyltransferase [Myxococcota bacterium]MEE2779704.1 GNAT family N-acetyltransferase [Myxococcota bacterium]
MSDPRISTEHDRLAEFFQTDKVNCAYLLGDLEPGFREMGTWYVQEDAEGSIQAVLMIYTGLSAPVMITHGQTTALSRILRYYHDELPGRCLVHAQPHHIPSIDACFETDGLIPTLRMALLAAEFTPSNNPFIEVESLSHRNTGEIIALYQHYPDNFFEPSQLDSGHYLGVRVEDDLVSVAGVHLHSPSFGIAALGNIVTHPEHRGRGLSTACTEALCERLFEGQVDTLALNVRRHNRSAVRVYEKLGFRYHDTYLEGFVDKTPPFDSFERS